MVDWLGHSPSPLGGTMTFEQEFKWRVDGFLRRTGLSRTALGLRAVGDPNLMREIEGGRSPSLRTVDRVLAFIAAYELDSGAARLGLRGRSGGARAPPESSS